MTEPKTAEVKVVPCKPTPEMLNAAVDATGAGSGMSWFNRSPQSVFETGWSAMLSAAPSHIGEAAGMVAPAQSETALREPWDDCLVADSERFAFAVAQQLAERLPLKIQWPSIRSAARAFVAALSAPGSPAEKGEGEAVAFRFMHDGGWNYSAIDPRSHVADVEVQPLYTHPASDQSDTEKMRDEWRVGREEGRLAPRAWQQGDPIPAVGSMVLVSGAHGDIDSDQHRAFTWQMVIGYGEDHGFICLQEKGCWPHVQRMTNCWFAALAEKEAGE